MNIYLFDGQLVFHDNQWCNHRTHSDTPTPLEMGFNHTGYTLVKGGEIEAFQFRISPGDPHPLLHRLKCIKMGEISREILERAYAESSDGKIIHWHPVQSSPREDYHAALKPAENDPLKPFPKARAEALKMAYQDADPAHEAWEKLSDALNLCYQDCKSLFSGKHYHAVQLIIEPLFNALHIACQKSGVSIELAIQELLTNQRNLLPKNARDVRNQIVLMRYPLFHHHTLAIHLMRDPMVCQEKGKQPQCAPIILMIKNALINYAQINRADLPDDVLNLPVAAYVRLDQAADWEVPETIGMSDSDGDQVVALVKHLRTKTIKDWTLPGILLILGFAVDIQKFRRQHIYEQVSAILYAELNIQDEIFAAHLRSMAACLHDNDIDIDIGGTFCNAFCISNILCCRIASRGSLPDVENVNGAYQRLFNELCQIKHQVPLNEQQKICRLVTAMMYAQVSLSALTTENIETRISGLLSHFLTFDLPNLRENELELIPWRTQALKLARVYIACSQNIYSDNNMREQLRMAYGLAIQSPAAQNADRMVQIILAVEGPDLCGYHDRVKNAQRCFEGYQKQWDEMPVGSAFPYLMLYDSLKDQSDHPLVDSRLSYYQFAQEAIIHAGDLPDKVRLYQAALYIRDGLMPETVLRHLTKVAKLTAGLLAKGPQIAKQELICVSKLVLTYSLAQKDNVEVGLCDELAKLLQFACAVISAKTVTSNEGSQTLASEDNMTICRLRLFCLQLSFTSPFSEAGCREKMQALVDRYDAFIKQPKETLGMLIDWLHLLNAVNHERADQQELIVSALQDVPGGEYMFRNLLMFLPSPWLEALLMRQDFKAYIRSMLCLYDSHTIHHLVSEVYSAKKIMVCVDADCCIHWLGDGSHEALTAVCEKIFSILPEAHAEQLFATPTLQCHLDRVLSVLLVQAVDESQADASVQSGMIKRLFQYHDGALMHAALQVKSTESGSLYQVAAKWINRDIRKIEDFTQYFPEAWLDRAEIEQQLRVVLTNPGGQYQWASVFELATRTCVWASEKLELQYP